MTHAPQGQAPAHGAALAYPAYGPAPTAPAKPPTLKAAVILMYVGAALAIISAALPFAMYEELRALMFEDAAIEGGMGQATDMIVMMRIFGGLLVALIAVVLWVLNAVFSNRGRHWARVLSTVLGVISLLGFLIGLTWPDVVVSRVLAVLNALLVIAVLVLVWLPPSNRFFSRSNAGPSRR